MIESLFLDFDGVLHPDGCDPSLHFIRLPLLEVLLRQHSQVEIVISSTWRIRSDLHQLRGFFSPDIAARVVGHTPLFSDLTDIPDRLLGYPRHAECWAWQRMHRAASDSWIAVDDQPWLFYPMCGHLVRTEGRTGLDAEVLRQLTIRLR